MARSNWGSFSCLERMYTVVVGRGVLEGVREEERQRKRVLVGKYLDESLGEKIRICLSISKK